MKKKILRVAVAVTLILYGFPPLPARAAEPEDAGWQQTAAKSKRRGGGSGGGGASGRAVVGM